jgi:hypothetical protein
VYGIDVFLEAITLKKFTNKVCKLCEEIAEKLKNLHYFRVIIKIDKTL